MCHRRRRCPPRSCRHLHAQGGQRIGWSPAVVRTPRPSRRWDISRARLCATPHGVGWRGARRAHTSGPQGSGARQNSWQHQTGAARRSRHGDRVVQGPPRYARRVCGCRSPCGTPDRVRPGEGGRVVPPLRGRKAQAWPYRFRRPAGPMRRTHRAGSVVCRRATLALPAPFCRRVSRRKPAPGTAAPGLAGRPPRPLRGGRREPGHLRLERRRRRLPQQLRSPSPRGRGRGTPR